MKGNQLSELFFRLSESGEHIAGLRRLVVALAISERLGPAEGLIGTPPPNQPSQSFSTHQRDSAGLHRRSGKPVTQEELPEGFPHASAFLRLGDVAKIEKGKTGIKQAQRGPYKLVVTGAERLSCDHFDFDTEAAIVPLVSSTGHGNASLNRLHFESGKFALGTILAAAIPLDTTLMSARFLFEYLSAFKDELLVPRMTGTANVTLTIGKLAEVPVPLVSRETQLKVDELMALLDRLEAARSAREATRDRLTTASLARLTAPDTDPETLFTHTRFALDALPALTTRADQIKQLRQTILSLAVRGKLEEQNSADQRLQPPSKTHPEIEGPFDIPHGWRWARLRDLGTLKGGGTPSKARDDYWSGSIPWVSPKEMKVDAIHHAQLSISEAAVSATAVHLIPARSVLFVVRGMILAHSFPVAISGVELTINQDMKALVLKPSVAAEYMLMALKGLKPEMLAKVQRSTHGTCRLEGADYADFPIPVPPLAEQDRIVAKVDELMALCDRLEAALQSADTTRARLLEALLHEALAGREPEAEAA